MTATTARIGHGDATASAAGYVTLGAVLLGSLIGPMLMSGTAVALPAMGADLDASGGALQWVVTGYFLAAACCMLTAGSLADQLGRRRVLRIGAAVYVVGTAAVAAAPDIWVVDVARTVSGIGAAGIMAAGGALLAATFDGPARTRAFAAVGTVAGVGLAIGPTAAGLLVGGIGWRATFLVFAVLGSVILLGTAFAQESRSDVPVRVDRLGAITLVAGLGLVLLAVTQLSGARLTDPAVLGQLAAGAGLLVAFVRIEKRVANPLFDLDLLRDRRFTGWCLSAATLALGSTPVLVTLPTYLQGVNGLSPGRAGAVMLMLTVPIVAFPSLGARLVNRGVSPRLVITVALAAMSLGNAWLSVLHPGISAVGLLGPFVAIGAGNGLALGIIDARAMALVPPNRIGMASGLLNTVRGGSNAVLLALFGAVMVTLLRLEVGDNAVAQRVSSGEVDGPDAAFLADSLTDVWRAMLFAVATLCAASAAAVAVLLRPNPSTSPKEN
ncbi:MFS transporter [Rhodococcus sp. NPDC127528]|uniref:MFS transporter n=1 Tax=unclassified Rhodococcus (in: high G+C Gram-positive bacteria) TaxID=192944 RepID=UPI00363B7F01